MAKYLLSLFLILLPFALAADTPYMDKVDEADRACADSRWADAEKALGDAIALEPDNPGNILLMSNLGMVRFHLGRDAEAIETLTEAHRLAPASVTILSNRARVLTAMDETAEAMADYELIMQLDSTHVSARFNHGMLALRQHKFAEAKADFEYLREHNPASDEALIGEATMLCTMGDYGKAIPLYTELLRTVRDPEYLGARALCYLMTDDLQAASDDINEALSMDPEDGELYLYRAALNRKRYLPDDAARDARRAIELGIAPARCKQFLK